MNNDDLAQRILEHHKMVVGDKFFEFPEDEARYWFSNSEGTHRNWDLLSNDVKNFYMVMIAVINLGKHKEK